jgi:prepilin-type processing-associated H-X9-DG protein
LEDENLNGIVFTEPITPLFAEPSPGGELADEALYGMAAEVLGEERGMLKVRMRYRYEGYVDPRLVSLRIDAGRWESSASHVVISPTMDVMSSASYRSEIVVTIPRGAVISAPGRTPDESGWIPVDLADGRSGYVKEMSVRPIRIWNEDEDELRSRVASDALLYMGAQYRWGGKSHLGIDCSGLASMSYMLNGLYIYRDARIAEGFPVREIDASSGGRGDLLFWDGHVAVYLGDGLYVHSTGRSSGVVINSLYSDHPSYREDLSKVIAWGSVFKG